MKLVKRFTETEKWKDRWFAKLKPEHKLFWIHLCDTCDPAGYWEAPLDQTALALGIPDFDFEAARLAFGDRIVVTPEGAWWLTKFIRFQNPRGVSENHNYHKPIYKSLRQHGVDAEVLLAQIFSTLDQPLTKGMPRDQDKDKDNLSTDFETFWKAYPIKKGKDAALRAWQKKKPSLEAVLKTIAALKASDPKWKAGYIQHPATWLNAGGWQDEVESNLEQLTGIDRVVAMDRKRTAL